jgi:hypothetical protein
MRFGRTRVICEDLFDVYLRCTQNKTHEYVRVIFVDRLLSNSERETDISRDVSLLDLMYNGCGFPG